MMPGLRYFQRRRVKHMTEAAQLPRLKTMHALSDRELIEIRDDWEAGFAREIADNELVRRSKLTAHEKIREAVRRGPAC